MATSDIKAFSTAAHRRKREEENGEKLEVAFTIDDDTYTASPPKGSAFLYLLAAGENTGMGTMLEAVRFVDACLPADQRAIIANRLRDPDDDFDVDVLMGVFQHLVKEFTTRPTESQSD